MKAEPHVLDEGLRLFFTAAAIHGAIWPVVWVLLYSFGLPFAGEVPTSQWHAHEMIFGTYGAALAGFLTSAVPEWTNTSRWRGGRLLLALALWLPGRLAGLVGADWMVMPAGLADAAFLLLLLLVVAGPMWARRNRNHASFALGIVAMLALEVGIRFGWLTGNFELSATLLHAALAIFIALMALATTRINNVVINNALDPSGETRPYRPHPGRTSLASVMAFIYAAALVALPTSQATAWLALAAAAAFLDRTAEWFIGRAVLRLEVLSLATANLLAAAGLAIVGFSGLGLPLGAATGLHAVSMGALGLAILAVFSIAGLRHTGRDLLLPLSARIAMALVFLAALVRVGPEIGVAGLLFGPHYATASLLWAAGFGVWIAGFLPWLLNPGPPAHGRGAVSTRSNTAA